MMAGKNQAALAVCAQTKVILPFKDSTLSAYDFSTLYTTLPHLLVQDKLIDLIEPMFSREKASLFGL